MLFWHLGASLWLFRWIFRDPKVDVRFLLLGAIAPDILDLPIGTLILGDRYSTGELWAHSLLIPSLYMAGVLLATRRGRRRRAFMALGVGWLLHLLLDGMWTVDEVFLWPFLGWEIPSGVSPYWRLSWERAFSDPWRWLLEAVGVVYLWAIWVRTGLSDVSRRHTLLKTGRIPLHADPNPSR